MPRRASACGTSAVNAMLGAARADRPPRPRFVLRRVRGARPSRVRRSAGDRRRRPPRPRSRRDGELRGEAVRRPLGDGGGRGAAPLPSRDLPAAGLRPLPDPRPPRLELGAGARRTRRAGRPRRGVSRSPRGGRGSRSRSRAPRRATARASARDGARRLVRVRELQDGREDRVRPREAPRDHRRRAARIAIVPRAPSGAGASRRRATAGTTAGDAGRPHDRRSRESRRRCPRAHRAGEGRGRAPGPRPRYRPAARGHGSSSARLARGRGDVRAGHRLPRRDGRVALAPVERGFETAREQAAVWPER